jgi:hypothetical protein
MFLVIDTGNHLRSFILITLALLTQAVETSPRLDLWDIAAEADVRGGDAWVDSYPESRSVFKEMIDEHHKNFAKSACNFTFTIGKKYSFGRLLESPVRDETVFRMLKRHMDTGEVRTAIAMEWDGVSGNEDECDYYAYRFMAKNHKMLVLEYDLSEF